MTEAEVVDQLPHKADYETLISQHEHTIQETYKEINRLRNILYKLKRVDVVINGKPINVTETGNGISYMRFADAGTRSAEVYLNAKNQKTFGVRIDEQVPAKVFNFHWYLGRAEFTKDEAKTLSLEFITGNESPDEFKKKYEARYEQTITKSGSGDVQEVPAQTPTERLLSALDLSS